MKRFHEIKEYTFAGLIDNFKKFSIPNFQRSYKWGSKQINDFFACLDDNEKGYFIGNIVCVIGDTKEDGRLSIVDGQQRLTTILILLIALRDYTKELSQTLNRTYENDWLTDSYLKVRDRKKREDYYVLHARKSSYNNILVDLIEGQTLDKKYDKAQIMYLRAYKALKSLVADKVNGDIKKIEEFIDKVLDLEVVAIILSSDKEVFNAFEGLNSKGLGLSTSDQIKNFLLSHAESLSCVDEVEQKWEEMELDFEKTNPEMVTKFLRHLWIAKHGYVSGKDLYDKLKADIRKNKNKKSLLEYCDHLILNAKFYVGVKYKNFHHYLTDIDEVVTKSLTLFRLLDNQQVYEVLQCLYHRYIEDKDFKPKYFKAIIVTLWNFCLRTKFLTVSPSKYERKFAEYCNLIRDTNKSQDILNKSKNFFAYLRHLTKDRDQFVSNINVDLIYSNSDSNQLLEYLLKLVIEAEERGVITFTEKSIEHILPKEPKEWGLTKKEIKDYVDNLGNLTLLHPKDNGSQGAGNKKMQQKCRDVYDKSHFKLNRMITEEYKQLFIDDFKEAIKQRGEDIASRIYNLTKI